MTAVQQEKKDELGTECSEELHIEFCMQCDRDTYHVKDNCVHVYSGWKNE